MSRVAFKFLTILFASLTCDAWQSPDANFPHTNALVVPVAVPEYAAELSKQEQNVETVLPEGSSVVLIGDSLAVGMSSTFEELAKNNGYSPTTHAALGTRVDQWNKKIVTILELHHPKLVLISLGTNEILMGSPWIRQHSADYKSLVTTIESFGCKAVWISPPNLDEAIFLHAAESRFAILNASSFVFDSQKIAIPRAKDGVHSSPGGYKTWMNAVWKWLADEHIVKNSPGAN